MVSNAKVLSFLKVSKQAIIIKYFDYQGIVHEDYFVFKGSFKSNTSQINKGTRKKTTENELVRGRLKICSKSLVFVPQESSDPSQPDARPLLKFPLADCSSIEGRKIILL